jgi:hypothetical protein
MNNIHYNFAAMRMKHECNSCFMASREKADEVHFKLLVQGDKKQPQIMSVAFCRSISILLG